MTHDPYLGEWERDDPPPTVLDGPAYLRRDMDDDGDIISAIGQIFAAAPRPHGTPEEPTHPGWWFVRLADDDPWLVVRVDEDADTGRLIFGSYPIAWSSVHGAGLIWGSRAAREPTS